MPFHSQFDADGNLTEWNGEPILLNSSIQRDPAVVALLEKYRPGVVSEKSNIAGISKVHLSITYNTSKRYTHTHISAHDIYVSLLAQVFLNGTSCRAFECNLGNLVTDAMVHSNALLYSGQNWTDAGVAFMQGGGIRASAYPGNISRYDLITMFPFNNTLYKINITGDGILAALERSVERYNEGHGEFLQMSGVHVVYDLRKPCGKRVKSVQIVCRDCEVPAYYPLDLKKVYGVIITDFTYDGGDGYTMFKKYTGTALPLTDVEAVDRYLRDFRTVYPAVEWRITLEGEVKSDSDSGSPATMFQLSMSLIVMTVLLNIFKIIF